MLTPILHILQHFFNLAIGYPVEESKYLKFGNKLKYLEFRNYLDSQSAMTMLDLNSYGWEMLSDIAATIVMDEQLNSFLEKLFSKLLTGVFDNTLNFNDNPLINNILSYIFVLLEKRVILK